MPKFIVKTKPDQDLYVIWSTIVDSPIMWGTRAQVEAYDHEATPDRFARADKNGSSCHPFDVNGETRIEYGWNTPTIFVRELGAPLAGMYTFKRDDLTPFLAALGNKDLDRLRSLLTEIDTDEEPADA